LLPLGWKKVVILALSAHAAMLADPHIRPVRTRVRQHPGSRGGLSHTWTLATRLIVLILANMA
jgi:hypothetical protein